MKKDNKGFIKGLIITFIVSLLVAGLIFSLQFLGLEEKNDADIMVAVVDSLTLSGGLGVIVYLLSLLSEHGAFDIISYSVKLLWYNTFHKNIKNTALPKNYTEYKMLKRQEETENVT